MTSWSGAWLDYYLNHWRERKAEELEREREFERIDRAKGIKHQPRVTILEDRVTLKISFELPEVDKNDIELKVSNTILEISAKIKGGTELYHRKMHLPSKIEMEAVKATYANGTLEVILPLLKEQTPKMRTVPVNEIG